MTNEKSSDKRVKILIVYSSQKGYTRAAAYAHAQGANAAGGVSQVVEAELATSSDIEAADALIFGSPIHMGTVDWRMKAFIDKVCGPFWSNASLVGRVGGVFATGGGFGSAGGGVEGCLLSMLSTMAQLGLIIVPLPRNAPGFTNGGTPWGPYLRVQSPSLDYIDVKKMKLRACYSHGFNISRTTQIVNGINGSGARPFCSE